MTGGTSVLDDLAFLLFSGRLEDVGSVELQFFNALLDVVQSPVRCAFMRCLFVIIRKPPPAELLDGADVDDPVMEMVHELGHVLIQEALVCMDRVTSQRALSGRCVLSDK